MGMKTWEGWGGNTPLFSDCGVFPAGTIFITYCLHPSLSSLNSCPTRLIDWMGSSINCKIMYLKKGSKQKSNIYSVLFFHLTTDVAEKLKGFYLYTSKAMGSLSGYIMQFWHQSSIMTVNETRHKILCLEKELWSLRKKLVTSQSVIGARNVWSTEATQMTDGHFIVRNLSALAPYFKLYHKQAKHGFKNIQGRGNKVKTNQNGVTNMCLLVSVLFVIRL